MRIPVPPLDPADVNLVMTSAKSGGKPIAATELKFKDSKSSDEYVKAQAALIQPTWRSRQPKAPGGLPPTPPSPPPRPRTIAQGNLVQISPNPLRSKAPPAELQESMAAEKQLEATAAKVI